MVPMVTDRAVEYEDNPSPKEESCCTMYELLPWRWGDTASCGVAFPRPKRSRTSEDAGVEPRFNVDTSRFLSLGTKGKSSL